MQIKLRSGQPQKRSPIWTIRGSLSRKLYCSIAATMFARYLLLMDEPFGALDAQTREVMHDLILHIVALERPTIVFVTHDVEEAVYLADRVVVLAPGAGRIDSVWPIGLPPALERTQDLKRSAAFLAAARDILDRIRATSGLHSDLDALRRLTGQAKRAVTPIM
jgi:NitT/TauT family transport system ATP-binding protein